MSKIKAVLFDLDGTLLPMDMDTFVNGYFGFLVKKAIPLGYDGDAFIKAVWGGVKAMVMNDGSICNEEAFWKYYASVYGEEKLKDKYIFDDFYANEFKEAKQFCGFNPLANEAVHFIKSKGFRTILATNPIFPSVATRHRISWAGLDETDFEFFTSYEGSHFSKPNTKYYEEVLNKARLKPEECLMVGNDVDEDMIAGSLGLKVFLITDTMINKSSQDISVYPHGNFEDLMKYIEKDLQ